MRPSNLPFNGDLVLVFALAVTAWGLGWLLNESDLFSPGTSAIAMFAGMAVALLTGWDFPGGRVVIRRLLPVSIVLLGFELNLSVLGGAEIGIAGVAAIAATVFTSFIVAAVAARFLGVSAPSGAALG
ncbi:MAG: putative sulfate exporter family transporter, partial [Chloroflexi bacterium]|nr:putative sulfate exporter family transporter [Chloroflexota bacterium]